MWYSYDVTNGTAHGGFVLVDNHKIRLRESLELITWSVGRGVETYQRTIGFHSSAASVDLLNIYLHQATLLDTSSDITHRRMGSERMLREALPFDFPQKAPLIQFLCAVEAARSRLCYGRPQAAAVVQESVTAFGELRRIFHDLGANED